MNKAQLIAAVKAKKGFHSIIKDAIAPDHEPGDLIEKRYFYINHINADGTAGKTFVFYMLDTVTGTAWFYNVETESVDTKELNTEQKKIDALKKAINALYPEGAFFLRYEPDTNLLEADVYVATATGVTERRVIAYKRGGAPVIKTVENR